MTTRLMVWNIQKLTINKFQPEVAGDPMLYRAVYILQTIRRIDPDILVLVEVQTAIQHADAGQGFIVSPGSGGQAVLELLRVLRHDDPAGDWQVVPPLLSGSDGKKEGIAVFFKDTKVNFRGPYQIDTMDLDGTGTEDYGISGEVTVGANGPYPAPWHNALPANPPAGGPINGQVKNQNQLAGRPFFQDPTLAHWGPHQRLAPMQFPDPGMRSPYLTVFREIGVAHPRNISVLSCHLPPATYQASKAIDKILLIPEVTSAMAADDVRVVCGDFNINFNYFYKASYFMNLVHYDVPRPGGTTNYAFWHPIAPTIYRGVRAARLEGSPPYYDVISKGWETRRKHDVENPGHLQGVDAIFAAFGTDPAPALDHGEVVNRVVDTPYVGPVQIDQAMAIRASAIQQFYSLTVDMRDDTLRRIENFGKIRRASDHMPVYADL